MISVLIWSPISGLPWQRDHIREAGANSSGVLAGTHATVQRIAKLPPEK